MAGKGKVMGDGQATRELVRIERDPDLEKSGRRVELKRATRQARRETPAVGADMGFRGYVAFRHLVTMGVTFLEANRGQEPTQTPLPVRLLASNWIPQAAADRVSPKVLQEFEGLPDGTYMVHGIKVVLGTAEGFDTGTRQLEVGFALRLVAASAGDLARYLTILRGWVGTELKDRPNGEKPAVSTIPPPLRHGQTFIGLGGLPFKLTGDGVVPLIRRPAEAAQEIADGE